MAEIPTEAKKNAGWANLRPAQPGEVRNPHGGRVPKDIREMRQYNLADVERKLNTLLQMNIEQLTARMKAPETKNMERMLGMILHKAIANADPVRASFILDRAGHRLPNQVQPVAMAVQNLSQMPNSELIELGTAAISVLQGLNALNPSNEDQDDD